MSTHKCIDTICCVAVIFSLLLTGLLMNAESFGISASSTVKGYEARLFDAASVHTIDIVMDDWESFIDTCTSEEYTLCSVVIDGEAYKNVAIRAKGNTSLTQVESYGNDRYSFKIEFDHYDSANSYYGLDKLSLNNIIQDNTYMKDFLTYQMMDEFGVDAPLCSYADISVNGESWGLYLAVEGVEESFLERNYGSDYGELYKPDSMRMGGGRGNGSQFNMSDFSNDSTNGDNRPFSEDTQDGMQPPDGEAPQLPGGGQPPENAESAEGRFPGGGLPEKGAGGGMGSDDVKLIYSDDQYDSYANIFDNAKTDVSDTDKNRLIASLKQLSSSENISGVVDVDKVIRYFVVHNFVCNFDSYTGSMVHNYYLYEDDGQLSMIPWDYNLAFGGFQSESDATALVNYPIDSPVSGGTVDSRPMLAWIFSNDEYTELYHQYFSEFLSAFFESGAFSEKIDAVTEMIAPFVESDATKFCTYDEFLSGADTLKGFCLLRAESIRQQLDGSIPSTSDGQAQDPSARIDASGITISEMGSMGMGGKGNNAGMPTDRESPQNSAGEQTGVSEDSTVRPSPPDGAPAAPDAESGNPPRNTRSNQAEPNGQTDPSAALTSTSQSWILLGVSCLFLLLGLLFALFYRKRV